MFQQSLWYTYTKAIYYIYYNMLYFSIISFAYKLRKCLFIILYIIQLLDSVGIHFVIRNYTLYI